MFRVFILFFLFIPHLYADVIVRTEIQQGATIDNLDLRLFDGAAPLTVANFLGYVNRADYENSFIHRSASGFIVQGGGFTFNPAMASDETFTNDPLLNNFPGDLKAIPTMASVVNEFGISNTRGTIAMAKLGGDPNSATSQWFFNFKDNSENLDSQNGGFTVFGEVLGTGIDIIDAIEALPTVDQTAIHTAFGALPLIGYTASDPVVQSNLVRVNSMTEMLSITPDIDFGPVLLATTPVIVVTITNMDAADLVIGAIADTDGIATPFSMVGGSDNCSGQTLVQFETCTLSIDFSPSLENTYSDTFNIEFTSLSISYTFSVVGVGSLVVEPDITPGLASIDFGETQIYDPANGLPDQIVIFFDNDGNQDLIVSSGVLSGPDVADFEFFENCSRASPIAPSGFCVIPVNFKPLSAGDKSATLTIYSNDPDESPLIIPVTGLASLDTDGIPMAIENAAPNSGDGNNDDILDSDQSNVVSLVTTANSYITLVASNRFSFNDISVLSEAQLPPLPENVKFDLGVLDFKIVDLVPSQTVSVGLILPAGYIPETYYMYGPTPDDTNPHWYEFMDDGITGATIMGNVSITSPSGNIVQRSFVQLVFKDGARGDADLTENGTILDPGGVVLPKTVSDSSGNVSWLLFIYMLVSITILRDGIYKNIRTY